MRRTLLTMGLALTMSLPAAAAQGTISGTVSVSGGEGQTLLVYVEKGPDSGASPAAPAHKEVMQKDMQFQPGAIWVRPGDTIDFVNQDNFYHNVYSTTKGSEFDLGLYRGGVKKSVDLRRPGEVDVYCNLHPLMHAKVLVLPTGRAAEVAADGSYSLTALVPGPYTIVAWSPAHEPVRRQVQLKSGETAQADFTLKPRAVARAHLNKNGEQYGRYK